MEVIIPASQVQVGDFIRFSLKNYFFNSNPEWREQCEQTLRIVAINPDQYRYEGRLEFHFDEKPGRYSGIDPNTEVILVHRSWPEGKNGDKILQDISHIIAVPELMSLIELREAIEDYLLGLPTKIPIPDEPKFSSLGSIDTRLKG